MAHGFYCTKCGYQESEHHGITRNDNACTTYESPDDQLEADLWADDEAKEQEYRKRVRERGPAYET